jgi:predicted phosphoribosyltransferase
VRGIVEHFACPIVVRDIGWVGHYYDAFPAVSDAEVAEILVRRETGVLETAGALRGRRQPSVDY